MEGPHFTTRRRQVLQAEFIPNSTPAAVCVNAISGGGVRSPQPPLTLIRATPYTSLGIARFDPPPPFPVPSARACPSKSLQ